MQKIISSDRGLSGHPGVRLTDTLVTAGAWCHGAIDALKIKQGRENEATEAGFSL